MATLELKVKNGEFVSHNGVYVRTFAPKSVEANGWHCMITPAGEIICNAVRYYSDGVYSVRYHINAEGFASLTLLRPGQKLEKKKKGFVVPKGAKLEGVLRLSGGNIADRYASFRSTEFQEFLDEFGITAVMREDPNREVELLNTRHGGGIERSIVWTDGTLDHYDGDAFLVNGATWVILTHGQDEGNNHNFARILYTTVKDATSLRDSLMANKVVAEFCRRRVQVKALRGFSGREVHCVEEAKKILNEMEQIVPLKEMNLDGLEKFFEASSATIEVAFAWNVLRDYGNFWIYATQRGSCMEPTIAEGCL